MSSTWDEIKTIFGEEFRRATRRAAFRLTTLAVPAILLVLVVAVPVVRGLVSGGDESDADAGQIGILDVSGELIAGAIQEEDIRVYPDREAGVAALVAGDIESFFDIPQEFVESGRVEWLRTGAAVTAAFSAGDHNTQIQSLLRGALVGDVLSPEAKARFVRPATFESFVVEEGGDTTAGPEEASLWSVSRIFSLLLLMGVLVGSSYLLQSVSDEKENRMMEILLTSVSPLALMAGKVLALGTVGLAQLSVWAVSVALIGPRIMDDFPNLGQWSVDPLLLVWMVAFFLAGYFFLGVAMAGIGAATPSYREASQVAIFIYLPSLGLPMWLFMAIAGNPDGQIARTLSFVPFTGPLTMIMRIGASDIALIEIVGSLVVTVIGGIVLLWGSARIFRAGLLMYGQRMSLRRVFSALRQAG